MQITQEQVDALLEWIEDRKAAYLRKGFALAGSAGVTQLAEFKNESGLRDEDKEKSLGQLHDELTQAEAFHKEAKQILFAGRQGG